MKLGHLIDTIQSTTQALQQRVLVVINQGLTIRNWLIGFYILEYEQQGEDRTVYGVKLLDALATELQKKGLKDISTSRYLRGCRQFYMTYPELIGNQSQSLLPSEIWMTLSSKLTHQSEANELITSRLSYSHFLELLKVGQPLKRSFYETESIRGN